MKDSVSFTVLRAHYVLYWITAVLGGVLAAESVANTSAGAVYGVSWLILVLLALLGMVLVGWALLTSLGREQPGAALGVQEEPAYWPV